ncbi:MAG: hypothetical protein HN348_18110 [Proteobacteria bacterium]|nr:hypothetical protein [Pseudomonadota bacterium]
MYTRTEYRYSIRPGECDYYGDLEYKYKTDPNSSHDNYLNEAAADAMAEVLANHGRVLGQ